MLHSIWIYHDLFCLIMQVISFKYLMMIFFMTGKYFTCNLLDLMTYLLKHEHHEWFVTRILEKIKFYFKLKNCGVQNVLKLFWIRLPHFLFVIFNSMFFMFDNLYQFCFKQHSKIMAILINLLQRIRQLGKKFHVKNWKLYIYIYIYSHKIFKNISWKKMVATLH
jgi:hypothetical protein